MVETEQPAKPFTGAHLAFGLMQLLAGWEQQQILLALMISLLVMVDDEVSQRGMSLEAHPVRREVEEERVR